MKKFISLLLLPCILLVTFTSCSLFEEESAVEVVDDSTVETIMDMDNLITELYSIDSLEPVSEYSDSVYFHVPQINCTTDDAIAINNDIQEKYGELVEEEMASYENGCSCGCCYIGWELYVDDDNTFALIVFREYSSDDIYYDVYNFSAVTGRKVGNREILSKMNLTDEEFIEKAQIAVTAQYNDMNSWVTPDIPWYSEVENGLAETMGNINVDMPMFINQNGGLSIIAMINTFAGSGYQYTIVEIV